MCARFCRKLALSDDGLVDAMIKRRIVVVSHCTAHYWSTTLGFFLCCFKIAISKTHCFPVTYPNDLYSRLQLDELYQNVPSNVKIFLGVKYIVDFQGIEEERGGGKG